MYEEGKEKEQEKKGRTTFVKICNGGGGGQRDGGREGSGEVISHYKQDKLTRGDSSR